ncbi:unnamed protein product [Closterium sp. Yama58-4]|nr:unnamed protein product [Closterium sp. Yama58-4]
MLTTTSASQPPSPSSTLSLCQVCQETHGTVTGGSTGSSDGSGGGGSLGYAGMGERSIAVEFDTAKNTDANDPDSNHVGLRVSGKTTSIATAKAPVTLNDGKPKHAWVIFDPTRSSSSSSSSGSPHGTGLLQVFLSASASPRPSKATLSVQVSLCRYLKPSKQEASFLVGFTASSSDSPQQHSILTWNINAGDCWAYAVVGSVEMAYGILTNLAQVPLLSVTQLREALGSSCSQGNSPAQAFQYLITLNAKASVGLVEEGKAGAVVTKASGGPYRVNGFERTAFHGWFGLLLAVQRQPVVVHVQATAPSFLNHDGLSKYADPDCFTYNLNHVVLLVGYRLTGSDPTFPHMAPPFWIIRNSWGPQWGDGGHMRMDIQGGDGVCGINTLPGIYPVVRTAADPCNVDGKSSEAFGPLFNPCGSFKCTVEPDGSSNRCDCNDPRYVEARNLDGSRTCAYSELSMMKDACRAAVRNPCAVGTCVNDGKGSYSCVCPPGFRQGTTVDGTFSCAPGDTSSKYRVVMEGLMCADIHPVYGLTLTQLQDQNPSPLLPTPFLSAPSLQGLSCSAPLAVGTVVNVVQPPSLTPCSVYYTTSECVPPSLPLLPARPSLCSPPSRRHSSFPLLPRSHPPPSPFSLPSPQGDTCESLATYFSLTTGCPTPTARCAAAFQALNPGLDCSGGASSSGQLPPSQAVCVERRAESAAALLIPVCSQFYLVQAGETCEQIRSAPSPPLSPIEFFRLNPGIKCSRLVPKTDVGSLTGFEVCSLSLSRLLVGETQLYRKERGADI